MNFYVDRFKLIQIIELIIVLDRYFGYLNYVS